MFILQLGPMPVINLGCPGSGVGSRMGSTARYAIKINSYNNKLMNKKQQQLFIAFFEQLYEAEQSFEQLKHKLLPCHNSLNSLFSQISHNSTHIEISQLRNYLQDKVTCNQRQLYQLFEKMDIGRHGSISRADFLRELTPLDREVNSSCASNAIGDVREAQTYFLALVMEYIGRFRIIEVARKQIAFVLPYNAFAQIDKFKTGLIGLTDLQQFMLANDFSISEQNLMLLLHALRRRCYLQVNLEVFCENLDPLEFGYYRQYQESYERDTSQQELKRSRREEEIVKISRIQSKKIEYNLAKEQRRRKADLERELELQARINAEIVEHEQQKQRLIRRAILEEDKNIRWNVQSGTKIVDIERQAAIEQAARNEHLRSIRNEQVQVQTALARTAISNEEELEFSRRVRQNIEQEKQLQRQIEIQKEIERRNQEFRRQRALLEQLERQRQFRARQSVAREHAYLEQSMRKSSRKRQWVDSIEQSRKIYEEELRLQRDRAQRQYELDRIRGLQYGYESAVSSRRAPVDLKQQLEQTRLEMRERQSRLNLSDSKRLPQTADRSSYRY